MAEDHRYQVNINAVPEDFGLVKTKKLILEKLEDQNAVAKIAYFRNDDQSPKKSVVVVHLKTAEHVRELLESAKIEVEFKDSLRTLLITKPRMTSISQASNPPAFNPPASNLPASNQPASNPLASNPLAPMANLPGNDADLLASTSQQTRTPRSRSKVRSFPDLQVHNNEATAQQEKNTKDTQPSITQQQCSLYVTRIPNHMYDEDVLRAHFERFGSVVRVFLPRGRSTRYAIVRYDEHRSAARALQIAADIRPYHTNLRLAWDSREAEKLIADASGDPPSSKPFQGQRNRHMQSREVPVVSAEQVSWSKICERDSDWFRGPAGRSLLVQDIPRYIDNHRLRSYFESNHHSGGGPVGRMVPLVDGVLIEFKDKNSADNVLERNDHVLDSTSLRLFRKPIPPLYKNRFIVKGNFKNNEAVKGLLECCDDNTEFTVSQHFGPNSFFVKCSRPLDLKKVANLISRASLDTKATIHEVCRTDCALVEGLGRSVTDDMIKLLFMNRKKTNGGDVTAVKRNPDRDRALVYFANYRDAENVVQKSKKDSITIGDNEVSVSLCHGGLIAMQKYGPKRHMNKPKQPPRAAPKKKTPPNSQAVHLINYVPECDNDIIEYIVRSQDTYKELRKSLRNLAHLDFANKPPTAAGASFRWVANFKPVQKKDMDKSVQNDQEAYERSCIRILLEFFSRFETRSCQLNADKLKRIRQAYIWNDELDFIKAEVGSIAESYPAFVRWNTLREGTKVTGYPHHVTSIIEWLKECCDHSSADEHFSVNDFQLLLECDIIGDVEQSDGMVKIKVEREFRRLIFKGRTEAVTQAKSEIAKKIKCMKESCMPFLDSNQLAFLKDALDETDSDAIKRIKTEFRSSDAKAVLRCETDPVLLYKRRQDLTQAQKILNDLIQTVSILIRKKYDDIVQSQEWRRLEQTIGSECRLYKDKQNKSITLVGFAEHINDASHQISGHINDNVEKKVVVNLDSLHVNFLTKFPKESGADLHLKDISWQVTSQKNGTLSLKGKAVAVSEAARWLEQEKKAIITTSEIIGEPGMAGYFRGKKGEQFLQTTQTVSKCVIQLNTETTSSHDGWNSTFVKKVKKSVTLYSVVIPGTSVTVSVLKEDITENNSDAIVNASNEELELRQGGVSGAILQKCGSIVQSEMTAHRRIIGGKLQPGNVVVTSGGTLACQKIIHVSGPVWTPGNTSYASQCLTDCIKACLSEGNANNLKSIAIPAISCGVFGGEIKTCANLTVDAVVDYFRHKTSSSITKVCLVEMQRDDLLEEFKKGLTNIEQKTNQTPSRIHGLKTFFSNMVSTNSQGQPSASRLASSPQISILQKDIASHTADVIVTCTPPGHFASAQGSSVSVALLRKAGMILQRACQRMAASSQLSSGNVLETTGFGVSCQKIYHVLLDKRVAGSSIPGVIKKCLLMAENNGYSRIAFPAIGAGQMGYQPSLVASSLKAEINNFKGVNLKNVDIVLFPSDQTAIHEFNKVFGSSQPSVIKSSILPVVSVQQGDISQSHCDAIVNTTTDNFELTTSPLSQLIVNRAGNSIITECQSNPQYSGPNFRVTSGGNLRCKFLVHIVPPGNANALAPLLINILTLIDATMNLSSVAIPAIGSGNAGLNSALVAQAMEIAFLNLQATKPQHLKKIEVVIFDTNIIQDFQTNITTGQSFSTQAQVKRMTSPKPAIVPKPSKRRTLKIPVESHTSSEGQVQMLFCSKTQNSVDEARRRIADHVKEKSLRMTKDVELQSFGEEVEDEVMALEKKHNIVIRRKQTTSTSVQLVISGLKDNVRDAYDSARELMQQYKEALTCAEYVIWKYQDPRTNELSDFSLTTSFQIENAYKKDPKSTFNITMYIEGAKRTFSINLASMTETSLERNYSTKIVRSQKSSGENYPPEWEDIGNNPFKNVIVSSSSQEYMDVLAIFNATGSIRRPVSLKRLQNPTLYHQFQAQKRKVEARMKAKGSTLPVSRHLFHGTTRDVCESIYKDGFDRSHCGKNATAFGKGVYFATSCQYSQRFAQPDSHGDCRMFLAEVITGEFHQGDSSLRTPNFMDASKKERYDSVVNQMNSPAMFVVFKDASVYPAYILKYKQ